MTRKVFDRVYSWASHDFGALTMVRRPATGKKKRPSTERVARVWAEAAALLGDGEATAVWMNNPANFLPGQPAITPRKLASRSSAGANLLIERIHRTTWGIF